MSDQTQGRRILIDPVTRIEGHAKVSVFLNDQGAVNDVRFHVTIPLRCLAVVLRSDRIWAGTAADRTA